MAANKAMRVADEALRYLSALKMWQMEHTTSTWEAWVTEHDLSKGFSDHVLRVINVIFGGDYD